MHIPPKKLKQAGAVGILDALGAASFDDQEIRLFLNARQRAFELLKEKLDEIDGAGKVGKGQVKVFTFNDTVLITLTAKEEEISDKELTTFILLLRRLFVDSLAEGILFRGAIAVGCFFADDKTNTVLGDAVTDAAAWYDKADWIGLHMTPRTTLELMRRSEGGNRSFACVDYAVPLRDGQKRHLKACNWIRLLHLSSYKRLLSGNSSRRWFLSQLTRHRVPLGTEAKYFNSLEFFDHCVQMEAEEVDLAPRKK